MCLRYIQLFGQPLTSNHLSSLLNRAMKCGTSKNWIFPLRRCWFLQSYTRITYRCNIFRIVLRKRHFSLRNTIFISFPPWFRAGNKSASCIFPLPVDWNGIDIRGGKITRDNAPGKFTDRFNGENESAKLQLPLVRTLLSRSFSSSKDKRRGLSLSLSHSNSSFPRSTSGNGRLNGRFIQYGAIRSRLTCRVRFESRRHFLCRIRHVMLCNAQ